MIEAKVLITGANGFIGTYLVEECIKNGLVVYAAVRQGSNIKSIADLGAHIVYIDYTDINGMSELFKQCDCSYYIHNAGITKTKELKDYMEVNCDYLMNITQALNLSKLQVKKLVFVSSLAACGPADFQKNQKLFPNSIPNPVTNYGRSKLAAENFLKNQDQIPYIIIRPTAVYGPREKDLLQVFKLVKNRIDLSVGLLPQKLTFIYVKDLSKLIVKSLLSKHANKIYLATDGNIYTGNALNGFIKESLNVSAFKIKIPIIGVKAIALISEKISSLFGNYPTLNVDKVNEISARNWSCETADLLADLDFVAEHDLPKGIKETVDWYKENKWI